MGELNRERRISADDIFADIGCLGKEKVGVRTGSGSDRVLSTPSFGRLKAGLKTHPNAVRKAGLPPLSQKTKSLRQKRDKSGGEPAFLTAFGYVV